MKISDDYPILQALNALFIVSGTQSAIIYRLRKGEIIEKETIEIPTPTYSDKEGRFESRGPRGRLQGSGMVYRSNKQYIQQEFLKSLLKELKAIRKPFDSIYLFAPKTISEDIIEALPKTLQKKVKSKMHGNFTKAHPTELLTKLRNSREFKKLSLKLLRISDEQAKLLKR